MAKKKRVVKRAAPNKTQALSKDNDAKASVDYRSLTGHNYVSEVTGEEVRVDAGQKIEAGTMSVSSINHELRDGKIEEWENRKLENVVTEDEENELTEVDGVKSRREDGEIAVKEVDE